MMLLFFLSVATALVDTRIIIKQTYKQSPFNGGKYVISLPSRASEIQSVNWCSNSFIPLTGRAPSKQVIRDCKTIPLMNVPMYPSNAVEVDFPQAMLKIDPRTVARGDWDRLRSNLVIRSGGDGEFEQIVRFNPESGGADDDTVVEIGFGPSPPPSPAVSPPHARDNGIYYITLAGGAMIMVVTIALVIFRKNSARIRNWMNQKKQYSGEDSFYDFQTGETVYFDPNHLLLQLGKGADPAFKANQ